MKFVKKIVASVKKAVTKIGQWANRHEEILLDVVELGIAAAVNSTAKRIFSVVDPVDTLSVAQRLGRRVTINVVVHVLVKKYMGTFRKAVDQIKVTALDMSNPITGTSSNLKEA